MLWKEPDRGGNDQKGAQNAPESLLQKTWRRTTRVCSVAASVVGATYMMVELVNFWNEKLPEVRKAQVRWVMCYPVETVRPYLNVSYCPDVPTLVKTGDQHFAKRDLEGARGSYRAAWEYNPYHVSALLGLGKVAYEKLDDALAINWFTNAIEQDGSAIAYAWRANANARAKHIDAASRDFDQALRADPSASNYVARAAFLEKIGNQQAAFSDYVKASELDKQYAIALFDFGDRQQRGRNLTGAQKSFDAAAKSDPTMVAAYSRSAQILMSLGRQGEASKTIAAGLNIERRNPNLLRIRNSINASQGYPTTSYLPRQATNQPSFFERLFGPPVPSRSQQVVQTADDDDEEDSVQACATR